MDFDEMLEVWRTQDTAPAYRVNPALLHVVIQQDYAQIRRALIWNMRGVNWGPWILGSVMMVLIAAILFAATSLGAFTPTALDLAVTVLVMVAIAVSARDAWLSHERWAEIDRSFGASLQEDIRRNLARIDYQLSRRKSLTSSVLMSAPMWAAAILLGWVIIRLNELWSGLVQAFIYMWPVFLPMFLTSGYFKKELLEQKRKLSLLLDLLNEKE